MSTTVQLPLEQRFVLSGIDWDKYVAFGELLGERRIRLTYDRGQLELMTVSSEHEQDKKLLARLIEALTEELDIDIASRGSMTFRRAELERGLEPDECFWIANEGRVRGREPIDSGVDPPPDLVVEVEVSRSAIDRLGIYAALGVPEVWRFDGVRLTVCLLAPEGGYVESPRSRSFPFLDPADLARFVARSATESETKLVREFRAWVRERAAAGWRCETS